MPSNYFYASPFFLIYRRKKIRKYKKGEIFTFGGTGATLGPEILEPTVSDNLKS